MKISIEEEEIAKHKKDNTLKPWCPRPARKTYSCDEQYSPSNARGKPLANSSHVRSAVTKHLHGTEITQSKSAANNDNNNGLLTAFP